MEKRTDFNISNIKILVDEAWINVTGDAWFNFLRHWKLVLDDDWSKDDEVVEHDFVDVLQESRGE